MIRFAQKGLCIATVYIFALSQTGCATTEKVMKIKIPIPVTVPCKANIPKPDVCIPKEGRVEWLRCELANTKRNQAYIKQLEDTLKACQ